MAEQTGTEMIAVERLRQIEQEGWTPEHDAEHDDRALLCAARCYVVAAEWAGFINMPQPMPKWARDQAAPWLWDEEWWKPSDDPVRNLVKAGALIAAEIDRLHRRKES